MLRMMRVARNTLTQPGSPAIPFGVWLSAETIDAPNTEYLNARPLSLGQALTSLSRQQKTR